MSQLEVTFGRAMKFWWSLTWRTWVLMLPIMIVMNMMMISSMLPDAGQAMDPDRLGGMLMKMIPAYVVGGALAVVAMVYATRWALRTKWSDFRLLVVAPDVESSERMKETGPRVHDAAAHGRKRAGGIVVGLLLAALPAAAGFAQAAKAYLLPGGVDLPRVLSTPPAPGSEAGRRDLAAVIEIQAARTSAEVAEAQADQKVSVFRFADLLGAGFSAERMPKTATLTRNACREASALAGAAKEIWKRPRPYVTSPAVKPVVANATDGSYPSGHATCGYLWAILLADMLPEKRDELFARGIRYGMNRVVGGVHYPSDVEAGRLGAAAIATAMFANPAFRLDLEAARSEMRAALGYARGAVAVP